MRTCISQTGRNTSVEQMRPISFFFFHKKLPKTARSRFPASIFTLFAGIKVPVICKPLELVYFFTHMSNGTKTHLVGYDVNLMLGTTSLSARATYLFPETFSTHRFEIASPGVGLRISYSAQCVCDALDQKPPYERCWVRNLTAETIHI